MSAPLGNFDPNAPIAAQTVSKAKMFLETLPVVGSGLLTRLYLHWAVAPFGCTFGDYNAMANYINGDWVLQITADPRDNAPGLNTNPEASHTWHRNTGALGIALAGMDGATMENFGPDGVTLAGLETLCAGAAALCRRYGIDALSIVPAPGSTHSDNNGNMVNTAGEKVILTHGECAVIDAYPDERWDLGTLIPLAGVVLTPAMRTQSGDALRQRIHVIKSAL